MKIIIYNIFLWIFIKNRLNVLEPSKLNFLYNDKKLSYTPCNFGSIPYGHFIQGTIYKGEPSDGCSPLSHINTKFKNENLIVILRRGNCHFSEKVLNAQKIGAKLVIIGNNENYTNILPIERDKEKRSLIHIPSIIIQEDDAKIFYELNNGEIEINIDFTLNKMFEKSNIEFILDIEDYDTLKFIKEFYKYQQIFKNNMYLIILFKLYRQIEYNYLNFNDYNESCDKDYCINYNDNSKKNYNGKDKINETINHICLNLTDDLSNYNNYLNSFLDNAFENIEGKMVLKKNFHEIGNNIIKSLNIDINIDNCLNNKDGKNINDNYQNQKFNDLSYLPSVKINFSSFNGNVNIENILEAFCNSFIQYPKECNNYLVTNDYKYEHENYSDLIFTYVVYGFIIFLIALWIFYLYYKIKIKKEMNDKLEDRINGVLNSYYKNNQIN